MSALPVEWVLVVFYGVSAHRATYGRLRGKEKDHSYTKDYIQLLKRDDFFNELASVFPDIMTGSAALTYKWPNGSATGALVKRSADRPHLKWETSLGAPQAWKMSTAPSGSTAETIPGDPTHTKIVDAEAEYEKLASRGAGQPYLIAVKLRDEPNTLHLRAYLKAPSKKFAWADIKNVPASIQRVADKTSQRPACACSTFQSSGIAPTSEVSAALSQLTASKNTSAVTESLDSETASALVAYLNSPGAGLFFDPARNHDAWLQLAAPDEQLSASSNALLEMLEARFPAESKGDAAAEVLEVSAEEVEAFKEQIANKDYEVPDSYATAKTRGSAQKAFADEVKANYSFRCAVTGISKKEFLIASHIVPWSADQSIRLDPANGICLSLLVDKAFEKGYLLIDDNLIVRVDYEKIGDDESLREHLSHYHERQLQEPSANPPKPDYLQRRRALVSSG